MYIAVRMFIENQSRGTHLEDVRQMPVPFINADYILGHSNNNDR